MHALLNNALHLDRTTMTVSIRKQYTKVASYGNNGNSNNRRNDYFPGYRKLSFRMNFLQTSRTLQNVSPKGLRIVVWTTT
ncbi:Catalase-related peroxidase [Dirofilaria immitis]